MVTRPTLLTTTHQGTGKLEIVKLLTGKRIKITASPAKIKETANSDNLKSTEHTLEITTLSGSNNSMSMKQLNPDTTTQSKLQKGTESCSTNWSTWSDCTALNYCGPGTQFRSRLNEGCQEMNETQDCESLPCIKISQHSSPKSFCTKSCGSRQNVAKFCMHAV